MVKNKDEKETKKAVSAKTQKEIEKDAKENDVVKEIKETKKTLKKEKPTSVENIEIIEKEEPEDLKTKTKKKINLPEIDVKALLEAGAHFGHLTYRWNPKMSRYIFAKKNGVHVIDLQKTAVELQKALSSIFDISSDGGVILFVGTKNQAKDIIKEEAIRSNSPYMSEKWLGGTLTNFSTIIERIKYLEKLEKNLNEGEFITKKEKLDAEREYLKLQDNFEGIREMRKLPKALFIVDSSKEKNAIREAKKLGIVTVAIVDTNADPEDVDFPIPANDDAIKSIRYITSLVAETIIKNKATN